MNGTLVNRLHGKRRVHIDSMAVIYFIEQNPTYLPIVRPLFELLDTRKILGISSYVTLLEVMVQPLKQGRFDLARKYRELIVGSGCMELFPVDQGVAEAGAEIRAKYEFRTPDAIQLATGVQCKADAFITNDSRLRGFDQLDMLVLEDCVAA